jgi:hypothetical protein
MFLSFCGDNILAEMFPANCWEKSPAKNVRAFCGDEVPARRFHSFCGDKFPAGIFISLRGINPRNCGDQSPANRANFCGEQFPAKRPGLARGSSLPIMRLWRESSPSGGLDLTDSPENPPKTNWQCGRQRAHAPIRRHGWCVLPRNADQEIPSAEGLKRQDMQQTCIRVRVNQAKSHVTLGPSPHRAARRGIHTFPCAQIAVAPGARRAARARPLFMILVVCTMREESHVSCP